MKTENINGFIWAVLTEEEALEVYEHDTVHVVYPLEDYRSFVATQEEDLQDDGEEIVLMAKIGGKEELFADYIDGIERNNETRSFEDWCLSILE